MASNRLLDILAGASILCLQFVLIIRFSTALEVHVTAKRSFKRCHRGYAFLSLYNVPLDQCLFECKVRSACDVMQYWRMRKECEMLTNDAASDVVNVTGTRGAAASCVRVGRHEITSTSGLFDQCSNCSNATVCDIEQGTCTIKECARLRVRNGTVHGNVLSVGANVTVRCDVGFYVENVGTSVTCLANGTWSTAPFCVQNVDSCDVPVALVTGDYGVQDAAISASSGFNSYTEAVSARFDNDVGWAPLVSEVGQYWQVVFPSPRTVVGIKTLGYRKSNGETHWVKSFNVSYSDATSNTMPNATSMCSPNEHVLGLNGTIKEFQGNIDAVTPKNNTFPVSVYTHCIRVNPQAWQRHIVMRIELWGCPSP